MRRVWTILVLVASLAGCAHYPPPLASTKGQTAAQHDADAKDCDHQVHSAVRQMTMGVFTAWSEQERDEYVACMQGKGYTVAK